MLSHACSFGIYCALCAKYLCPPSLPLCSPEQPSLIELSEMLEMSSICAVPYGGHQPHVGTEHLKCD